MFKHTSLFLSLSFACSTVVASPTVASQVSTPTVTLDKATVVGFTNNSVTTYFGIPFAQPPVGNLRLRLPQPIESYNGTINATEIPAQCIQLTPSIRTDMPAAMLEDMLTYAATMGGSGAVIPQSEDCLTINLQVPAGTKAGANLPVVAYIYGGGFTVGGNTQSLGDVLIQRSIELDNPVIFAAMNYRLNAFGFLSSKEVKEAGVGNLGLQDQREALRWINKHIKAFGGDPDKVTLWGQSAGSISVGLQLVANDGNAEGLFRGAIMQSGNSIPTGDITSMQPYYDTVVEGTGCANVSDTLDCLRQVPVDSILAAAETLPNLFSYPGLAATWGPYADGVFLKAPPLQLVLEGSVAKVAIIAGDSLDEGTAFATGAWNVTTETEFRDFVHQYYYPSAPAEALLPIFDLYPNDPAQGSPFGTGDANQLAPMYKRMAAFQGDMIFQAPRRFFLDQRSSKQPTWFFLNQRGGVSGLGCAHDSDFAPALAGPDELTDYIIQFVATLSPNGGNQELVWPNYNTASRRALSIIEDGITIGNDTLRILPMEALVNLSLAYPV